MIRYSKYDLDDQKITIKLDTGGEVTAHMAGDMMTYYGPGLDMELDFNDDAAKDVCFKIGGDFYTALQVIQWCVNEHGSIEDEARQEADNEDAMVRELSSPDKTGRI